MSFLSLFEIIFWLLRLPAAKSLKDKKSVNVQEDIETYATDIRNQTWSPTVIKTEMPNPPSFENSLKLKGNYNHYY